MYINKYSIILTIKRTIMRLSWRVPFAVTVAIGIIATINSLWSSHAVHKIMIDRRKGAVERVASQFRASVLNAGNQAAAIAATFAELPMAQESLKKGDRSALAAAVGPSFKALHERFGVSVLAYVENNAKIYYRAHNPEKYGDDASSRELITSTLQRKMPQYGIEAGNSGVVVRGVLPVGAKGAELGLVEVGIPFEKIINTVQEQTGFEIGVYVDAKITSKLEGRLVGSYKEIAATNTELMKSAVPDNSIDLVQEVVIEESEIDGVAYGTVRMPLLDFANQNLGTVVAIRSFAGYQKQEREFNFLLVIQAILMTVVAAGVINITFSGLVMSPIRSLKKGLDRQIDGQEDEIKGLTARSDEIGEIARIVIKDAA
jgi:methyl-accepting chemotaxis protein